MQIEVLKSKIHRATITEANLQYIGSLTLDEDLMDAANMIANEKIQVVNVNNGERIETYLIKGKRGSGTVCLNGPAARRGAVGDAAVGFWCGVARSKRAAESRSPERTDQKRETVRRAC